MKTNIWKLTTLAFAAAFALALALPRAEAERQPYMKSALGSLQAAQGQLNRATADKGGHRAKAMTLVAGAIDEVKAGIAFDNRH